MKLINKIINKLKYIVAVRVNLIDCDYFQVLTRYQLTPRSALEVLVLYIGIHQSLF